MLIRHLPVCRAASYPYTKIANNNNKSAGKKKIQRETERIPRLVRSIPTGGRRRTEAWYELYPSVVRAVPNCGRSRTKVRYKAYQPLVFPYKRRYYIGIYILLIESRLLRCKGCYPIILSIHANICKHPANIRLYTNCFSAYICSK